MTFVSSSASKACLAISCKQTCVCGAVFGCLVNKEKPYQILKQQSTVSSNFMPLDAFFSMPGPSPLKELQTSFQKPSGLGSPPNITHKTLLLILHIFWYWLWLNTLMGWPNKLVFPSQFQWRGILVGELAPVTSLVFDVPKQGGKAGLF